MVKTKINRQLIQTIYYIFLHSLYQIQKLFINKTHIYSLSVNRNGFGTDDSCCYQYICTQFRIIFWNNYTYLQVRNFKNVRNFNTNACRVAWSRRCECIISKNKNVAIPTSAYRFSYRQKLYPHLILTD